MRVQPQQIDTPEGFLADITLSVGEVLLTEKHVAKILGVSCSWLQKSRCYGTYGPPWIRISGKKRGSVRYRISDVAQYIAANSVSPPLNGC